jgi:hypothetical protein
MLRSSQAATLLFLLSSCVAASRCPDWNAIQAELATRVAHDQELREKLQIGGEIDMEVAHQMEQVDLGRAVGLQLPALRVREPDAAVLDAPHAA